VSNEGFEHRNTLRQLHRLPWPSAASPFTFQNLAMLPTSTTDSARVYAAVPQLRRIREEVLLNDVWKQPELAYRDRILVTLGVLAAGGKIDEMRVWMRRGLENGLTKDDLRGLIVQVTFYAGWPAGLAAGKAALELLEADAGAAQQSEAGI
jgi:4-carboxymuconolactone decarboxylase